MQITQIGLGGSAGDTSLLKLEYNYGTTTSTTSDNNGSLRQQKITVPGMSNQITQAYTYDYLNRLQSATETAAGSSTPTWKQTFTYDRYGNRRFDANNTTTLPSNNAVYNPNIGADNKFLVSEGYNYDSEGNLTNNPENQLFTYDGENKQIQVQNTSTSATVNYYYDGNGKRVKKVIGNQETFFVYNAFGKLVAEYTTNQAVTTEGTKYMTADMLSSARAITNALGQVVSRHDYMPFGEEVASGIGSRTTTQGYLTNSSGIRQDGINQQFTSYERDIESGLDFAQNRYFASKHGRFTTIDPLTTSANIKNPQTFNRYSYSLNSPYKFTDPIGLKSCATGVGDSIIGGEDCSQGGGTTSPPPSGQNGCPDGPCPLAPMTPADRAILESMGQGKGRGTSAGEGEGLSVQGTEDIFDTGLGPYVKDNGTGVARPVRAWLVEVKDDNTPTKIAMYLTYEVRDQRGKVYPGGGSEPIIVYEQIIPLPSVCEVEGCEKKIKTNEVDLDANGQFPDGITTSTGNTGIRIPNNTSIRSLQRIYIDNPLGGTTDIRLNLIEITRSGVKITDITETGINTPRQ